MPTSFSSKVADYLSTQKYLRSASDDRMLDNRHLCTICHGAKRPRFDLCPSCHTHQEEAARNHWKLADNTGFITYGHTKGKDQLGFSMYSYKHSENAKAKGLLSSLLYYALDCYWVDLFPEITAATCVPSTRSGTPSALEKMCITVLERLDIANLFQHLLSSRTGPNISAAPREKRLLDPLIFNCQPIQGHVLLIEDSWVSGSHAQSAAVTLHNAGASKVTVLSIARLLDSNAIEALNTENYPLILQSDEQSPFR